MSRRGFPEKWILDQLPKNCVNCGSEVGIVYHHIVPVVCGGNESPSNIVPLCSVCHGKVHYGKDGVIDHGSLVRSALKRAKENGKKLGKPAANYEQIMQLIAEHSTMFEGGDWAETEICEAAGVQPVCYYKVRRMLMVDLDKGKWEHCFQRPKIVRKKPLHGNLISCLRREREDVAEYRLESWSRVEV